MEKEKKDYKDQRFDLTIYVNDNIICKRNFNIYNYLEGSMKSLEFKETVDDMVRLIDEDLKSKTRVYSWYYFNPNNPDGNPVFTSPLADPWECTFKITISDNKQEVISKIWDGYAYPRFIRDRVDLTNKYVKITTRDGRTYTYDKDAFYSNKENRISFELEVIKHMISDKKDLLWEMTNMIANACSAEKGDFSDDDTSRYRTMLNIVKDRYTITDNYPNEDGSKGKKYCYNLAEANKKVESEWARLLSKKTKEYMDSL